MKVKIEDNINLLKFAEEVTDSLKDAVKEYHFKTINAMKRDAPVGETGDLRRSIGGNLSNDNLSSVIEATMPYAPYQEFGTITGGGYDSAYANSLGLDSYASQFKRGDSGKPTTAKRFFFKNSNANFIRLVDDFKI